MKLVAVSVFCVLSVLAALPAMSKVLIGVVRDSLDRSVLPMVSVINKNNHKEATADLYGRFSIPFSNGDTIAVSNAEYITWEKVMYEQKDTVRITIMLQSVYATDSNTVIVKGDMTKYQRDSISRRNLYRLDLDRKKVAGVLPSIFHPASALAQLFSKKVKTRDAFQHNFTAWEQEKYTDTRYTPELVAQLTGMQGDSLHFFMNTYPMPYDFARAASEMEIKMWIRYNYRQWIKNPVIPKIDSVNEVKINN